MFTKTLTIALMFVLGVPTIAIANSPIFEAKGDWPEINDRKPRRPTVGGSRVTEI